MPRGDRRADVVAVKERGRRAFFLRKEKRQRERQRGWREKNYTQTSGERPCVSETAAKFDMSKTLPTTHREKIMEKIRERQSRGTGVRGNFEMGSVTGTAAEFRVYESNTSRHQQGRAHSS